MTDTQVEVTPGPNSKDRSGVGSSVTLPLPPSPPSRANLGNTMLVWIKSIRPGRGILNDIRARAPYYLSDWTDAWNYRVIPATALIFFSKWVAFLIPSLSTNLTLQCSSWHCVFALSH